MTGESGSWSVHVKGATDRPHQPINITESDSPHSDSYSLLRNPDFLSCTTATTTTTPTTPKPLLLNIVLFPVSPCFTQTTYQGLLLSVTLDRSLSSHDPTKVYTLYSHYRDRTGTTLHPENTPRSLTVVKEHSCRSQEVPSPPNDTLDVA